MALPSSGVWEVRPTNGSDTNGGGFDSAAIGTGTDFSQQNAKNTVGNNISTTDLTTTTTGSFTCTSATAAFTTAITGNFIYLSGGSGGTVTTSRYRATYVNATQINLDRSPGAAATNVTMNIGGALQTLGQVNTILTASNTNTTGQTVWMKAEANVNVTAQITLSPSGGSPSLQPTQINGYTTTRGDNGQVTLKVSSGTSYTMLFMQVNAPVIIRNFVLDGNAATGIVGCTLEGTNVLAQNFLVQNCKNGGMLFNNNGNAAVQCTVTACCATSGSAFRVEQSNGPNYLIDCVAYANSATGFLGSTGILIRCISANNTGASSDGFASLGSNTNASILDHCLAYSNGRDGFHINGAIVTPLVLANCVAWGNSGKDINWVDAFTAGALVTYCNFYATSTNYVAGFGDVVLSGDPTVAGGSNNFALNNTAGAGAAVRGAGFPGVLAVGGTGYASGGPLDPQITTTTNVQVIAPTQIRRLFR